MKINLKFVCVEIPSGVGNGPVEISSGATIEQALDDFFAANDIGLPVETVKESMFLVNKAAVSLLHPLKEGDELTVVRPLGGG